MREQIESQQIEVSVVMPCLDEAETLAACIQAAHRSLRAQNVRYEIVIADNGSRDSSPQIAIDHGARVVAIADKGYGAALLGGIGAACGRYIIMGDADASYNFGALESFIERLRNGDDLVMGNRFRGGIAPGAMPPLHRYLGNPVLSGLGRLFFHSPCGDFHCGLRGFRRDAILGLDLRTTGMEFASEMIVKATLAKLRIGEVPTTLSPDGRTRAPHLRSWRDGWRHLRFLLLFSPRWLFLYPGCALIALGLVLSLWLLPGPRRVGDLTLDIHTLLYASMAMIVGFQAVSFAVFTKIFAISEGLMPPSPRLNALFRRVTLESGLLLGGFLLLLGIAASLHALGFWRQRDFGPLEPSQTLRTVIPAVTAFTLGCQMVLSSFFLSVLGLKRR